MVKFDELTVLLTPTEDEQPLTENPASTYCGL